MARSRGLLLLAVLLSATACAGVPSSGPVRTVRRVPVEAPDAPEGRSFRRLLPPAPPAGASPVAIVNGFLLAQVSYDADHAIARKYLAPGITWNAAAPVTVYTQSPRFGRPVVRGNTATVTAAFDVLGTIAADGDFRPPVRTVGPTTFRLRRVAGEWRLANAPPGVLLSRQEIGSVFQRVTLYFPNAARRLVPQHVFLRASDQPAASVVRALLAGPRGWIAPAVRSAIPDGTELLDPPTVVDGVVTLNFSREIRRAPQDTLGALIAQLVWSLTEPTLAVDAVRIQAEGDVLAAPGRGDLREHRRSDWVEYDPIAPPADTRLFFVRDGVPYGVDGTGFATRVAAVEAVESFAVNRTGTHLAAVVADGARRALMIAETSGASPPRRLLVADRLTAPTWEPGSDVVWTAATNGDATNVLAVPLAGAVAAVEATLPSGTVEAFRLSPGGSRAAVLVARPGAGAIVWMLRVQRSPNGTRVVTDGRAVAPPVSSVTAVTFDGSAQLVLAGIHGGQRTLVRLDVDGFNLGVLRVQGLPPGPVTAFASSTATPPDRIAVVGGRLWRRSPPADWAALPGTGTAATFAG